MYLGRRRFFLEGGTAMFCPSIRLSKFFAKKKQSNAQALVRKSDENMRGTPRWVLSLVALHGSTSMDVRAVVVSRVLLMRGVVWQPSPHVPPEEVFMLNRWYPPPVLSISDIL